SKAASIQRRAPKVFVAIIGLCVPKLSSAPAQASCPREGRGGAMSNDNKIAGTYEVSPAAGYAGDVAPATAWKILSERKNAVLIDVRTRAEWNYVGLP